MTYILFVDDDQNLVQSLRRVFYKMNSNWHIYYVTSGEQALEILDQNHIDIIITDIKMPEMSGTELLLIVKQKHPNIIRILLSGYSDDEVTAESTAIAHQFLRKPISPEILEKKLKYITEINQFVNNTHIKDIINEISVLPTLPDIYIEIDRALSYPETTMADIDNIIVRDIGIATKILQIVNSAFFGIPHKVFNTLDALTLLGTKTVQSIIASIYLFNSYPENIKYKSRFNTLGSHSLLTAEYSKQFINKFNSTNKTDAFTAGILHDVGKLIVFQLPDYDHVEELVKNKKIKLYQAEYEKYNTNHAEVGAYLLALWGLPKDIIESVAFHHDPSKSQHNKISLLTAVHIGNLLASNSIDDIDWKYIEGLNIRTETEQFVKPQVE